MITMINCSFRGQRSNSNYFLKRLQEVIQTPYECIHLNQAKDFEKLFGKLKASKAIVLAMPLYADNAPAQVVELMEQLYAKGKGALGSMPIYVIANLGFYESQQIHILLQVIENWCKKMGVIYGGGVAIGAGEMMQGLENVPLDKGPNKAMGEALKKLATCIEAQESMSNIYTEPTGFPRLFYFFAANFSWAPQAKKNGLKRKDLYRK